MEDYQSENDTVDIRTWAQQIHEQKIVELRKKIDFKDAKATTVVGQMHIAPSQVKLVEDICKLKEKLYILTKKSWKT